MEVRLAVLSTLLLLVIPPSLGGQTRTRPGSSTPRLSAAAPPYVQYAKSREETPALTKVVFKNGLTVLVHEFRSAPVVSIVTQVAAGTGTETAAQAGITNALVRCLLRGTKNRVPAVFSKELRTMGAVIRPSIGLERSAIRLDAPSPQWKKALELHSDIFLNPLFDAAEVEREMESIAFESDRASLEPDEAGRSKLRELAFPEHSYGRSPAGTPESVRGLTREMLSEHHRNLFTLDGMCLVVAGDVVATEVLNEVARLYGKIKTPSAKAAAIPLPPTQDSFRRAEIRGKAPHSRVLVGFRATGANADDLRAMQVLAALAGSGRGSILGRRVQEEKKLVRGSSTRLEILPGGGFLEFGLDVDAAEIDRAELAILTEIEMLKLGEPREHEFERALAILEREHWEKLQSAVGRAEALAYYESHGGWKGMNDSVARLRRVKPEDVARVARRYLTLENCSIVELLPEESERRDIPTDVVLKTIRDLLEPSVAQEMAARERETVPAFDLNREAAAFKYSEVRFPIQKSSIWRGPELFIKEDHTVPVVTVGLFFAGGKLLESPENNGITRLLLRSILRGGKKDEELDLQTQLEIYGARITPVVRDDYFGVQFSILSRHIEQGLDLLLTLIKNPKIEAETLERDKWLQLSRIRRARIQPSGTQLRAALFGDFPYSLGEWGSEAAVSSTTADALRAWYRSSIENKKPIVVIIGDTQGTSLASYFVRSFSGSRFQDIQLPEAIPKEVEKRVQLEAESGDAASRVLIGFQAPPNGDEDLAVVRVLENYLTGPGAKLHEELVERREVATSVQVRYEPRLRGGTLIASIQTSREQEEKAIEAFDEEIRKIWEKALSYKDYRLAINSAVGEHWVWQQSREAQIDAIVDRFLAGKGPESIVNFAAELQAVREEDLQEVARRLLSAERAVVFRLHARESKSASASGQDFESSPR